MRYEGVLTCRSVERKHVIAIQTERHWWRWRRTEIDNLEVGAAPGVIHSLRGRGRYIGKTDLDLARQIYQEFLTLLERDIISVFSDSLEVMCYDENPDGLINRYLFGKPMKRA